MKNVFACIFVFSLFFLITNQMNAQDKSCCIANDKFAALTSDKEFRDAHDIPLAFNYDKAAGEMITFNTPDGSTANAYFIKSPNPSDKYILVFQEWWGLNDYVKRESDELQTALGDVNILALDLYDGKVATTREEAQQYVQSVKNERVFSIIRGASDYAGSSAQIGTLGWCFGGAWSLQAGIELAKNTKAIVMYYGMPEENIDRLKLIEAPVFAVFANNDKSLTPEVADRFEANMKTAGVSFMLSRYDADHGFANPSNPKYNSEATMDAKQKTIDFFKTNLMK